MQPDAGSLTDRINHVKQVEKKCNMRSKKAHYVGGLSLSGVPLFSCSVRPSLSIDCVTSLLKDDSTSLTHGRREERREEVEGGYYCY